jgi:hypothetical protein
MPGCKRPRRLSDQQYGRESCHRRQRSGDGSESIPALPNVVPTPQPYGKFLHAGCFQGRHSTSSESNIFRIFRGAQSMVCIKGRLHY